MTQKRWVRLLAVIMALIMPLSTVNIAFAETGEATAYDTGTQYDNPGINDLTGHGEEPEEMSVSAGAEYMEKAWYEYVQYSEKAVSSYRLNDNSRLLFYDPYTYTNAMVMDVQFDAKTTEFDTMSSYTVSHTNSKTISACVSSTSSSTSAIQTSGRDKTGTHVTNSGYTKTKYNHETGTTTQGTVTSTNDYEYILKNTHNETTTVGESATLSTGVEASVGMNSYVSDFMHIDIENSSNHTDYDNEAWVTDKTTNTTSYSDNYKTTTEYSGDDTVENHTESDTEGWTELSARVTKTLGSSTSTSDTWSENDSTTVTKTYAATHFASDGVTPLPWAIVHYTVQMPMKCCLQVKHSGEWITLSTVYCLLTTVQGTCRAWIQNGQVYYEDWGSGEPVVETAFWSQFMTKSQLINAYKDKLYPAGGEN